MQQGARKRRKIEHKTLSTTKAAQNARAFQEKRLQNTQFLQQQVQKLSVEVHDLGSELIALKDENADLKTRREFLRQFMAVALQEVSSDFEHPVNSTLCLNGSSTVYTPSYNQTARNVNIEADNLRGRNAPGRERENEQRTTTKGVVHF